MCVRLFYVFSSLTGCFWCGGRAGLLNHGGLCAFPPWARALLCRACPHTFLSDSCNNTTSLISCHSPSPRNHSSVLLFLDHVRLLLALGLLHVLSPCPRMFSPPPAFPPSSLTCYSPRRCSPRWSHISLWVVFMFNMYSLLFLHGCFYTFSYMLFVCLEALLPLEINGKMPGNSDCVQHSECSANIEYVLVKQAFDSLLYQLGKRDSCWLLGLPTPCQRQDQ